MNELLLNASDDYKRLLNYLDVLLKRYDKASSLNLDTSSKFYRAYMEVTFRKQALQDTVRYIEKMSSELSYPDCVAEASKFIVEILNKYPESDENYSEMLDAVLKLPDCKYRMNEFCDSMNIFTDYEVISEELLFNQSVKMIASGIELLIAIREHICPVNKNCSTCTYFISYSGR